MGIWSCFLELLQSGFFTATQLCGGNLGWGIFLFSLALRLAVLPLSIRSLGGHVRDNYA